MAIFIIKGNKISKNKINKFKNEKELQTLFENNLEEILGVKFLASEFSTTHGGRIDTLGIDENNSPVIIEYKESEKDNVINQGLFYLDWLIDHKGDFEMLVQSKLQNIKVNWDEPILILVAQSYNEYDKYAVNRISENIELWRYTLYEGDVLHVERVNLPKNVKKEIQKRQTKIVFKEYSHEDHLSDKPQQIKDLFNILREEILKLDEQIQEKVKKHYIAFALDRNFVEIVVQSNTLKVYVDVPKKELNDTKNIAEDCSEVGHWATGDSVFKITNNDDISYAISLIKQSYESKL
jgi:predicted transport protein